MTTTLPTPPAASTAPQPSRFNVSRMWVVARATVEDALGNLSAGERTQLARLMSRVKARLSDMADTGGGAGP